MQHSVILPLVSGWLEELHVWVLRHDGHGIELNKTLANPTNAHSK